MPKNRSLADAIASALRLDICRGRLLPGTALRQEELAERFAVSRIPIRDALRSLELDGMVELFPQRGAFVAQFTLSELREITDLRVLVEGDLILHAVSAITPADLAAIRAAAFEAGYQAATQLWEEADLAFHEALYKPSQRHRQLALFRSLRLSVQHHEAPYRRHPEQRATSVQDHECILNACSEGDARLAQRLLTDHLRRTSALLVACVQGQNPPMDRNNRYPVGQLKCV